MPVLEKSEKIFVIPSKIGWDDIGTWKSVKDIKIKIKRIILLVMMLMFLIQNQI